MCVICLTSQPPTNPNNPKNHQKTTKHPNPAIMGKLRRRKAADRNFISAASVISSSLAAHRSCPRNSRSREKTRSQLSILCTLTTSRPRLLHPQRARGSLSHLLGRFQLFANHSLQILQSRYDRCLKLYAFVELAHEGGAFVFRLYRLESVTALF